jgi:hypothetical protein
MLVACHIRLHRPVIDEMVKQPFVLTTKSFTAEALARCSIQSARVLEEFARNKLKRPNSGKK